MAKRSSEGKDMTRYKGRTSPKAIEHDFPHHVEMIAPLGGFGRKLDDMYEWHWARGIQDQRGRSRRDENGADPSSAEAFAREFSAM
jgi:hypothetical protein